MVTTNLDEIFEMKKLKSPPKKRNILTMERAFPIRLMESADFLEPFSEGLKRIFKEQSKYVTESGYTEILKKPIWKAFFSFQFSMARKKKSGKFSKQFRH